MEEFKKIFFDRIDKVAENGVFDAIDVCIIKEAFATAEMKLSLNQLEIQIKKDN